MRQLSIAQWRALAHLEKLGPAHRLPGGIWTSEPDAWESGDRSALDDDWIRGETLRALGDRGLVKRDLESNTYSITPIGRTRLAVFHYTQGGT